MTPTRVGVGRASKYQTSPKKPDGRNSLAYLVAAFLATKMLIQTSDFRLGQCLL